MPRPTEAEIALAYLRVAHIYRRADLDELAFGYYALVANRFAVVPSLARRARLGAARCLVAHGRSGAARRWLRSVVRDPETPASLACHAALRLTALSPDGATTARRVEARVSPARFERWCRLAHAVRRRDARPNLGHVAESTPEA